MPIKKADLAESLKDSTESAYSLMRSPTRGRMALYLVVRIKTKKKPTWRNPLKDSITSAYSVSRPPASADLHFI